MIAVSIEITLNGLKQPEESSKLSKSIYQKNSLEKNGKADTPGPLIDWFGPGVFLTFLTFVPGNKCNQVTLLLRYKDLARWSFWQDRARAVLFGFFK